MPVQEQVVVLYAGTRGFLDSIEVSDVGRFESELLDWFRSRHGDLLASIKETGKVDEDALDAGVKGFAEQFVGAAAGGGSAEPSGDAAAVTTSTATSPTGARWPPTTAPRPRSAASSRPR